jgi:hypothetical protein
MVVHKDEASRPELETTQNDFALVDPYLADAASANGLNGKKIETSVDIKCQGPFVRLVRERTNILVHCGSIRDAAWPILREGLERQCTATLMTSIKRAGYSLVPAA